MTKLDEKLAGVDQALADLGKSEEAISEIRVRLATGEAADLNAIDGELDGLSEGVEIPDRPIARRATTTDGTEEVEASWDDESTEVEILDESDFVLLVDESDLEELEKVGEDDATRTTPPAIPQEDGGEDDGFFKKLFGSRRSRPPQP